MISVVAAMIIPGGILKEHSLVGAVSKPLENEPSEGEL
jgi:hypothetical protein